jgi:hypothetical protein
MPEVLTEQTTSPEVEAIARQLATDDGQDPETTWRDYTTQAQAVIAASRGLAYGS